MEPINDLLQQHELTYGNVCPGTLLALRMAVLGCALVGTEDPRGADRNKLVVLAEIDRWLADAVEAVTGAQLRGHQEIWTGQCSGISPRSGRRNKTRGGVIRADLNSSMIETFGLQNDFTFVTRQVWSNDKRLAYLRN